MTDRQKDWACRAVIIMALLGVIVAMATLQVSV